ncbi:unnamed protein product [Cylindrotheca closterium]|uniref:Uncharacterized protein n=1 Tax=Cylindrotheca closterium TaxID=2856 RepID=A0AAD2CCU8_9STRA|nr:unnamed protein product [Cylindrotheca closterium]
MVSSQEALELIPKISGGLSFVFSLSTAVYIIFFSEDAKKGFYNRLVIGMCFADMLSSFAHFLSTWPMPADSGAAFAVGNEATCRIQGFFTQYSISSHLYVASMGAFYLLAIKYGWKEKHFAKWGHLFHLIPIGFGLASSITVTVMDIIGPAILWCWIAPQEDRPDLDVNLYRMVLFYVPLWSAMLFVGINLIFVFLYVHRVTKVAEGHVTKWMPSKSVRNISQDAKGNDEDEMYCGQEISTDSSSADVDSEGLGPLDDSASIGSSEDAADHDGRVSRIVRKKQKQQIKMYARRRQEIANQCLRYAMAFYITWTPLSCVRILQLIGRPVPYGLLFLAAAMSPLQGLPNLLAFLYPMMRKKWKLRKHSQKNENPRNEQRPRNEQHDPKDAVKEMKPPSIVAGQPKRKKKTSSDRGIHGSSAWDINMGRQDTYDLDAQNFELSSEFKTEENDDIYTNPELYFMRKK